jgi:hypothetical protein
MTDDELREAGKRFIEMQCQAKANLPHLSDEEKIAEIRQWDYVDPIRLAVYVSAKSELGAFAVNMDRIRAICLNPGAFAKRPSKGSSSQICEFNEWNAAPKIKLPERLSAEAGYAQWLEENEPSDG